MFLLLKQPRGQRKPRNQSSSGMSAKDKRDLIGLILFMVGLLMAVISGSQSYSDYYQLTSQQLAWMTISEAIAPELTVTGLGIFLLGLGLIIFFSSSNKEAKKGVSRWFRR